MHEPHAVAPEKLEVAEERAFIVIVPLPELTQERDPHEVVVCPISTEPEV